MAMRIVLWVPPRDLFPYEYRPTSMSLEKTSLKASHPDLATMIGDGRVVGHQLVWIGAGSVNWIVSFDVED
ncbi:hypothetical protein GS979_07470 [Rhodococcus hoagii]|nr:hypothetical protein [Prescottella equi]NKW46240.1 hypothetical protein [Prescottella equi]